MEQPNSYEQVKKALCSENSSDNFNVSYVHRLLHEKENLRRIYLAVIKNNPALISEITKDALISKPICYNTLHKLIELNLVERIFVLRVINNEVKNDEIKTKFIKWISNMPENLQRYYLAKTSYWIITDFGKQFAKAAYEFEQEFRVKEKQKK